MIKNQNTEINIKIIEDTDNGQKAKKSGYTEHWKGWRENRNSQNSLDWYLLQILGKAIQKYIIKYC